MFVFLACLIFVVVVDVDCLFVCLLDVLSALSGVFKCMIFAENSMIW